MLVAVPLQVLPARVPGHALGLDGQAAGGVRDVEAERRPFRPLDPVLTDRIRQAGAKERPDEVVLERTFGGALLGYPRTQKRAQHRRAVSPRGTEPGQCPLEMGHGDEVPVKRIFQGRLDPVGRQDGAQVEEGPGRRGDGNPHALGDVDRVQAAGAVPRHPAQLRPPAKVHGHLRAGRCEPAQVPQRGRASVGRHAPGGQAFSHG